MPMFVYKSHSPSSQYTRSQTPQSTIKFVLSSILLLPIPSRAFLVCAFISKTPRTLPRPNKAPTTRAHVPFDRYRFISSSQVQMDAYKDESDNDSEPHNPRRGRPGIVVFSGGTAFNSAAAEMASRIIQVGVPSVDEIPFAGDVVGEGSCISRENSLVDLMTLGSVDGGMTFEDCVEEKALTLGATQTKWTGLNDVKSSVGITGGTKVWHVLPVTDDGGSTAEIVRVLGGPAVGDIRSRLLRLAPGTTKEARAVRRLLGHRLVSMESWKEKNASSQENITKDMISRMAREEWLDILDGGSDGSSEHPLWKEVSTPYRSIIRSFLVHFHSQVLQTHNGQRHSQTFPPFDFTGGSVGNFFFAGARTFFGSLPAAIFLFSKVAGIPSGSRVLPAVLTEERLVLGAELKNKKRIRGQYNISHPRSSFATDNESSAAGHRPVVKSGKIDSQEAIMSLHPSPISRITYLLHDPIWQRKFQSNTAPSHQSTETKTVSSTKSNLDWNDRHEIYPEPNPLVLDAIANANCIVYGCGSLFTSVLPSLILSGVGEAIAERNDPRNVPKILLLNGWHDRETSWSEPGEGHDERIVKQMDATACVKAIVRALDQGGKWAKLEESFTDENLLEDFVASENDYDYETTNIDDCNELGLKPPPSVTDYITHILYPIGTEIDLNVQSLNEYCEWRKKLCDHQLRQQFLQLSMKESLEQQLPTPLGGKRDLCSIKLIGVASIPANTCSDSSHEEEQSCRRVFHPPSLVGTILDLANGGGRLNISL
eukprot:CCRYP_015786-RA/>CCRYP_015786-RA protein AED:0.18 eAED:0.18 QI:222/1/1/1/1/1/2/100/766